MKSIKLFCLTFLITTCTGRTEFIDGKFADFNHRAFEFKKDHTFRFENQVKVGQPIITGRYTIADSIIFLNPDSEIQLDGDISQKLKIIDSQCLRDYANTFYCTTESVEEELTNAEYKFQEETVSILDTLTTVREARDFLDDLNRSFRKKYKTGPIVSDLFVDYGGIMIVNRREFHVFQYIKPDSNYHNRREIFIRLLVHKKPFEIYRLYDHADSLKPIYKE